MVILSGDDLVAEDNDDNEASEVTGGGVWYWTLIWWHSKMSPVHPSLQDVQSHSLKPKYLLMLYIQNDYSNILWAIYRWYGGWRQLCIPLVLDDNVLPECLALDQPPSTPEISTRSALHRIIQLRVIKTLNGINLQRWEKQQTTLSNSKFLFRELSWQLLASPWAEHCSWFWPSSDWKAFCNYFLYQNFQNVITNMKESLLC